MSSRKITLVSLKCENNLKEIFDSFRDHKVLSFKAKFEKDDINFLHHKEINTYEVEIFSIYRWSTSSVQDCYTAKAQLVGTNGVENKLPNNFYYPSDGVTNYVEIHFSNLKNTIELRYSEYVDS